MREPHVVCRPCVQRMSLCAIGIPVSGWVSPHERRASASSAALSAAASSTWTKAFSSPFNRPTRSRQARVSSTEEIFLAVSAALSSPRVALSKLLDDFGYEVEAVVHRRRDRLIKLTLIAFAHFVRPQALDHVSDVRHGLDAFCIHGAHLVDKGEHPVQAIKHRT